MVYPSTFVAAHAPVTTHAPVATPVPPSPIPAFPVLPPQGRPRTFQAPAYSPQLNPSPTSNPFRRLLVSTSPTIRREG